MEIGSITLREKKTCLGPIKPLTSVPWAPGNHVIDYIPAGYLNMEIVHVHLNGRPLLTEDLYSISPRPGDVISLAPVAGELIVAAIGLLISIAINVGMYAWNHNERIKAEHERRKQAALENKYEWGPMANQDVEGDNIPVIYGTIRTGGMKVGEFSRKIGTQDYAHTLLAISEGPIDAINPNGITDLHCDGNTGDLYTGLTAYYRYGTVNQTAIPKFRNLTTPTVISTQLLYGDSNAVTCTGTTTCSWWRAKLTAVGGAYYVGGNGQHYAINFQWKYRTRTTAGPGAWSAWSAVESQGMNSNSDASIWIEGTHAAPGQFDVQISRVTRDNDTAGGFYCDMYVMDFQEETSDDLVYPNTALVGLTLLPTQLLNNDVPRYTVMVRGRKIMQMTSASTVSAAAYGNNPADVLLDQLYNRRYGFARRGKVDTRIRITVSGASGDFDVDEWVYGPSNDYQFKGIVRSVSGTSVVIECWQGLPHGTLTGQTSAETATCASIDEAYAVDLTQLWAWHEYCDDYVPDGSGDGSTVNNLSSSGGPTLFVAATTDFTADDWVIIDPDGDREEYHQVQTVNAGVSLTLKTNLTYTHTLAQGDAVKVAEKRCTFDGHIVGETAEAIIDKIILVGRAFRVDHGEKLIVRPWIAETPGQFITEGDIVRGSFKYNTTDSSSAPNAIDVNIHDRDNYYEKVPVPVEDPEAAPAGEEIKYETVTFTGCTRRSAATREGLFWCYRGRYAGNQVEFELGQGGIDFVVGDVFRLCYGRWSYGTQGGRVLSSSASTVVLDKPVTLGVGTYKIRVEHLDGTQEEQTITSAAGTHRTISISPATWTSNPVAGVKYGVGITFGRMRCLQLELTEQHRVRVIAEEDDEAYYICDPATLPEWTANQIPDPNEIPPDVEELAATMGVPHVVAKGNDIEHRIDVSWVKADHDLPYSCEVWIRENCALLQKIGRTDKVSGTGNSEFNAPRGIHVTAGLVFIVDTNNACVKIFNDYDMSFVRKVGTYGTNNGEFNQPFDVWANDTHFFVADMGNHRIQKFLHDGTYVTKIGTVGGGADNFYFPAGITGNATYIFVADWRNSRLVKVDLGLLGSGGGGTWATFGANGSGANQFDHPVGIDIDTTAGILYVADALNYRIVAVDDGFTGSPGGTWVTAGGTCGDGDDEFEYPTDVVVDHDQNRVWVSDDRNCRIHIRNATSLALVSFIGITGDNSITPKTTPYPQGLALSDGKLWISDRWHQIQIRDDLDETVAPWVYRGDSADSDSEIVGGITVPYDYEIAVISKSINGAKVAVDDAPSTTITTSARAAVPPDVTGLRVVSCDGVDQISWRAIEWAGLEGYWIKEGAPGGSSTWERGSRGVRFVPYSYPTRRVSATIQNIGMGTSRRYFVKAQSKHGIESDTADYIDVTMPLTPGIVTTTTNERT